MAETQAQNKLGELFVDLGVGGLGKTLKALNSVSASFLLTKNAAQQALKPIVDMSRQGSSLVTAFDKINAVTGISTEKLQSVRNWAKINNVSFESLVASIENVQQSLMDIRLGKGLNKGYQLLGIEAWQLDPNDPLKALDLIQAKLKQVNEVTGATALRELGMNTDLAYTFKQAEKPISEAVKDVEKIYNLSQEQIQNLREQQEKWNEIDVASEKIKNNIASWQFSKDLLSNLADMMKIIAEKGFIEGGKDILKTNYVIEDTDENKEKIEFFKRNPYRLLPKWLRSTDFMINQEQKRIDWYDKQHQKSDIYIGDEKIPTSSKNINSSKTPTIQNAVGATPINSPAETLPPLPNFEPTSYTTNNSNSQSINYSPTFNMQIDVSGDGAEQTSQIQQAIVSQQELTFTELLNMAGK